MRGRPAADEERDVALPNELLRMYRVRAGLTQTQLARLVGLRSLRMVQYWEAGTSLPKARMLQAIIAVLVERQVLRPPLIEREARRLWAAVAAEHERYRVTPYPIFDAAWFAGLAPAAPTAQVAAAAPQAPPLTTVPAAPNPFIGRGAELIHLDQLLQAGPTRLVTLVGPGGVGKTRLAREAAERVRRDVADGIWWCDLAALTEAALLPQIVAWSVGMTEAAPIGSAAALSAALRARHLLVVLDTCERLLDACARLVHDLLAACPAVRVLATSREALNIAAETVVPVEPFAVPEPAAGVTLEEVQRSDAVALFCARATAIQPAFRLDAADAPVVAAICRRLDGLPLAIELAAMQTRTATPAAIAARLDDRFALLDHGWRTAPPRQQGLQASLAWSYALLSDQEQVLLRRLAIFLGRWTVEQAVAICAEPDGGVVAPAAVPDLLTRLVGASLVVA
jgi:predicted ATPase/transcriptional regulator with XRE-family HTH domain